MSLLVSAPPPANSYLKPPQLWTPLVPGSALNEILKFSIPVNGSGERDLLREASKGFERGTRESTPKHPRVVDHNPQMDRQRPARSHPGLRPQPTRRPRRSLGGTLDIRPVIIGAFSGA